MEDGVRWEGYVDWRNRPAVKGRHGGMVAACFVLVAEVLENLAFLANASNLVTYLINSMHYSPSQSVTTVTNFMGTAFLLALLGGFLSDAVCTNYTVYLISASVEFMGLVILTIQARSRSLMPPSPSPCGWRTTGGDRGVRHLHHRHPAIHPGLRCWLHVLPQQGAYGQPAHHHWQGPACSHARAARGHTEQQQRRPRAQPNGEHRHGGVLQSWGGMRRRQGDRAVPGANCPELHGEVPSAA